MSELMRGVGDDPLLIAGVRILTPLLREVYAVLLRAGIIVIDDCVKSCAPAALGLDAVGLRAAS